jgi:hypothetical protein
MQKPEGRRLNSHTNSSSETPRPAYPDIRTEGRYCFPYKLLYVTSTYVTLETKEPEADDNIHDLKVETEDDAAKTRRVQGYGPGSGVGA